MPRTIPFQSDDPHRTLFEPTLRDRKTDDFYQDFPPKLSKEELDTLISNISDFIKSSYTIKDSNIMFWMTSALVNAVRLKDSENVAVLCKKIKQLQKSDRDQLLEAFRSVATSGSFKDQTYAHTWVHQMYSTVFNNDLMTFVTLELTINALIDDFGADFIQALTIPAEGSSYRAGTSGISSIVFALTESAKDPLKQMVTKALASMLLKMCQQSSAVIELLTGNTRLSEISLTVDLCGLLQGSIVNNTELTGILCNILATVIQQIKKDPDFLSQCFTEKISKGSYAGSSNFHLVLQGLRRAAEQPHAEAKTQFIAIMTLLNTLGNEMLTQHYEVMLLEPFKFHERKFETGASMLFSILTMAQQNNYNIEALSQLIEHSIEKCGIERFVQALAVNHQRNVLVSKLEQIDPDKLWAKKLVRYLNSPSALSLFEGDTHNNPPSQNPHSPHFSSSSHFFPARKKEMIHCPEEKNEKEYCSPKKQK